MTAQPCRIVLRGELSHRFAPAFPGFTFERVDGTTVLVGEILDQSHLFSVLTKARDLALDLVGVEVGEPA